MADDMTIAAVAQRLREMPNGDGSPVNVRDDADAIARVALTAIEDQPRRAKEVRGSRNG